MRRAALVLLVMASASIARAADDNGLVALLPLDVTNARMDTPARVSLEEAIRTIVGDALTPLGYTVLTGETTLAVLTDNGIDAEKACQATCALQAARELKAKVFVSGTVATSESVHIAFIRLFEAASGKQLASVQLEGATVRELRAQFKEQGPAAFLKALGKKGQIAKANPRSEEGRLGDEGSFDIGADDVVAKFESTPAGAVVFIDERLLCQATPCSKTVAPGSHEIVMQLERHEVARSRVDIKKGMMVFLTLTPSFGRLTVETTPMGLPVMMDGKPIGKSPILRLEVDKGSHELYVDDPCWTRIGQRVIFKKDETDRSIRIEAKLREAAIKVKSEDEAENAIEAQVTVDGKHVGSAPGTIKIPFCSKQIVVTSATGRQWKADLKLREKEISEIKAVFPVAKDPASAAKKEEPTGVPLENTPNKEIVDPILHRRAPQFAVRAGFGTHLGILGVGVEYRPMGGRFGIAVGTGVYALTAGFSIGLKSENVGGPYLDGHFAWSKTGLLGVEQPEGFGFGGTVGWDLRPIRWLSIKAGIGSAYNTARTTSSGKIPVVFDLQLGPVF